MAQGEDARLEEQRLHQRLRRGGDRHRPHDRRRHQNARRRVDRAAADPADRRGVQRDAPPLRPRRVRADAERVRAAAAPPQQRADPDWRAAAGRGRSVALRRNTVGRRQGDLRRRQPGEHRTIAQGMGGVGRPRQADRVAFTVSLVDGAAARVHRADLRREGQRLCHCHPAGVRAGALVAPSLTQPDVAADQGRAALSAEHRRHQRAVPYLEIIDHA